MHELSSVLLAGSDILVLIMRGKSRDIFYRRKHICDSIIIAVNSSPKQGATWNLVFYSWFNKWYCAKELDKILCNSKAWILRLGDREFAEEQGSIVW